MNDPVSEDTVDVEADNNTEAVYYMNSGTDHMSDDARRVTMTLLSSNSTNSRMTMSPNIYDLNNQKALSFIPIYIVLGCIVVMGVLTNILVCYIYRCRSRRATSNFFVIFFAIFDMFGCFIGIPLEVTVLALPYTYDVVALCKLRGFIESWSVCCLCLTLICVAYDCYRQFCRPGEDFGVKKARICCIISVLISAVVSVPAAVVFGVKEVNTKYSFKGETCSVDPNLPLWLRIIYNICVLGTFLVCLCAVSALYCLIGVACCLQRQAEERGEKPSPAKQKFPKKHRFVREEVSTSSVTNYSEEVSRIHSQGTLSHSHGSYSDSARVPLKSSSGGGLVKTNSLQASSTPPSLAIVPLHVKNTRQTSIFMVISIIFVVSMLPYIVVMILCAATTFFSQFSSSATEIIFNLCVRSYLLNYIVKPVIYFIFNVNFRKEVKHLFIKIWSLCTGGARALDHPGNHSQRRSFIDGSSRSASRTPIYRPPRSSS